MNVLQFVSLALDILLIVAGILTYTQRPRLGGLLSRGIQMLLIGLVILGFSHMIETGLFIGFNLDQGWNEILHRALVAAAFGFVLWGFRLMQRALDE